MTARISFAAALAYCCAASLGCQSALNCGDGCGRGCSMAFQKYDCSCDSECGSCCGGKATCGSSCGDECCKGCGECDGPVRRAMNWAFGCNGCGECYWNEWHNDPPRACEPCNRCGQYIGPGSVGDYRAPYRQSDAAAPMGAAQVAPLQVAPPAEAAGPTDVQSEVDQDFLP